MTGIERLRDFVGGISPVTVVCGVTRTSYDREHMEEVEVLLRDFLDDIADQIEREHNVSDREEHDVVAWVREHGGLSHVKDIYHDFRAVVERLGIEWSESELHGLMAALDRRLMPEGMEWPTVDGKPVVIGERMRSCGIEDCKVVGIDPANARLFLAFDDIENGKAVYFPDSANYRHRPAPKVLDADGVEIRVGDVLYSIETGDSVTVDSIEPGNPWFATTDGTLQHCAKFTHRAPVIASDGKPLEVGQTVWHVVTGREYTVRSCTNCGAHLSRDGKPAGYCRAEYLIHTKPEIDSWERVEADCSKADIEYCNEHGLLDPSCNADEGEAAERHCIDCGCTCGEKMARDIVRRCRALAERERGKS